MEQNGNYEQIMIPMAAYENEQIRKQEIILALVKAIVALTIFFLVVIGAIVGIGIKAWSEYDYVDDYSTEVDVDSEGGGNANYIGNDGDIYNGEGNSKDTQSAEESSQ